MVIKGYFLSIGTPLLFAITECIIERVLCRSRKRSFCFSGVGQLVSSKKIIKRETVGFSKTKSCLVTVISLTEQITAVEKQKPETIS